MSRTPVDPDPFEMDDAAYVLGSLSPAERSQYEQHLQSCAACARAVSELAGLPGMLRRLPVEVVESLDAHDAETADDPGDAQTHRSAPPTLLAGALHRVELEERRERRARVVRRVAAVTIGAAAATVGVLAVVDPGAEAPPAAAPSPTTAPSTPPPPTTQLRLEALVDTTLAATISLREVAWGTKIQVECAYPEQGAGDRWADVDGYSLVVQDADGDAQQVATWNAVAGRELTIDAATAVRGDDIVSFEIRSLDGDAILRTVR